MGDESETTFVDLLAQAECQPSRRLAWSHQSADLSVNLVTLWHGEEVEEHRNDEVDVLMTGIAGSGSVRVGDAIFELSAGQALLIPKGAIRATQCSGDRFIYLTCHRSRPGLWPIAGRPAGSESGA